MKNVTGLLLILSCSSFTLPTGTAELTRADRDFIVKYYTESRDNVLKTVKGLTPEQANFKPAEDKWSVNSCLEHIILSENLLWGMVDESLKKPADPSRHEEVKVTDENILTGIPDRTNKVKTFDALVPKGTYPTLASVTKAFRDVRNDHINFLKKTPDDLRNHYVETQFMGTIESYQMLLFIAAHSKRHLKQIEEIIANPNFPKK
ncbi:MAG TPA: DinB family protein [Cyclobacteriaceae bacterium]|nr:DinB family protein [Cyclobacteriaceae bacterium]